MHCCALADPAADVPTYNVAFDPQLADVNSSRCLFLATCPSSSSTPVAPLRCNLKAGKVAGDVHRLGAVRAECGVCREIGKFRDAALFAHDLLTSRRRHCKCCVVQFFTRVRHKTARLCGFSRRESITELKWSPLVETLTSSVSAPRPRGPCNTVFQPLFLVLHEGSAATSNPSAHGGSWWVHLPLLSGLL